MAFAVATCPKCEKRFRLLWNLGKRRIDKQQRLRLTCPACHWSFQIIAVELPTFEAGKNAFSMTFTVREDCLVGASYQDHVEEFEKCTP